MPLEEIARVATAISAHAVTRIGAGLDSADAWKPLADKVRIETRSL
jgi:fructose-1-phosphate kinase PfkB-like protein